MKLFVGIEGFSTRCCVAVLATEDGTIRGVRVVDKGISLHTTDRDELRCSLQQLLSELFQAAGVPIDGRNDCRICMGLCGTSFPFDAQIDAPRVLQSVISLSSQDLLCTGDAEIIFLSHSQSPEGAQIVCGMGSRATAIRDRRCFHYGGWGPAFGDQGSGYGMGREVLRALGAEYDSGQSGGALWSRVCEHLIKPQNPAYEWEHASIHWRRQLRWYRESGFTDTRPALFSFAHSLVRETDVRTWRSVVSSLVLPLMTAWQLDGDAVAADIVRRTITALVSQLRRAVKRAGVERLRLDQVVLYGGVITHNPAFRALLTERLRDTYQSDGEPIWGGSAGAMRPVFGALLLALGEGASQELRLPPGSVIERIREQAQSLREMTK